MTQSLCALLHSLYSLPLTQGANPTHLPCLSLYHSKDLQRLELPSTKNPFIFVVLQGRLALHNPLHTPFGIRIYTDNTNYTSNTVNTNNQYFISNLTTPLKASVMPSKEGFMPFALALIGKSVCKYCYIWRQAQLQAL